MDRKLLVILFADIAGYSSLMQQDETQAKSWLRSFREIVREVTPGMHGQVIHFYGDGCVCTFESSVNSLECARQLQVRFSGAGVPVRIGLHSGDVYFDDNNVYGDSVNIASRIETMALPGSVLFSARVKRDIANQPDYAYRSLGTFQLKNIAEPLEVFALEAEGIVLPKEISPTAKVRKAPGSGKTFSFGIREAVFTLVLLAIVLVITNWASISGMLQGKDGKSENASIAVMDFQNISGQEEYQVLAKMATNRIIHAITQNNLAQVVTGDLVDDYQKVMTSSVVPVSRYSFMNKEMQVGEVIEGNIYVQQDTLYIECTITDAATGEVVKGLPTVSGPANQPMETINEMRQSVLGYLVSKSDGAQNLLLEQDPPKYDAYRELTLAKGTSDYKKQRGHLIKAIQLDPDYFEPKMELIANYYNNDETAKADSMLAVSQLQTEGADARQLNLLNFYDALLKGKNNLAYEFLRNEYNHAPYDLTSNYSAMVVALQFVNRLDDALEVYKEIPEEKLDYAGCSRCRIRMFLRMYIDIELGNYSDAIRRGEELIAAGDEEWSDDLLVRAYIRSGNWDQLDRFLQTAKNRQEQDTPEMLYRRAAVEALNIGEITRARDYSRALIADQQGKPNKVTGQAYYILGDMERAIDACAQYLQEDSTHYESLSYLAGIHLLKGDEEQAGKYLKYLDQLSGPYTYGEPDYWKARAYAIAGDKESAYHSLEASVSKGFWNTFYYFHHDLAFQEMKDEARFHAVRNFWK